MNDWMLTIRMPSSAKPPQRVDARMARRAGDHAAMRVIRGAAHLLDLCLQPLLTEGKTNLLTSPPSWAISRTIVPEMNWYWSDGVRNIVSTSGSR